MGKYLEQQYDEREYALELAKKHKLLHEDKKNMTWGELKEEAKKMGAEVYTDVIYYSNLCFWEFGDVETQGTTFSVDDKTIAEGRTPDQMLAIMKALQ